MPELDLHLDALHLNVVLINRQVEEAGKPYHDWLGCEVLVSVPSFSGRFKWEVTPGDLLDLANDLDDAYKGFPKPCRILFEPAEPNVVLHFDLESSKHMQGHYILRGDLALGPILEGDFIIDQSYLPGLSNSNRKFVNEAMGQA
jgi:hypothetical protein